MLQRCDWCFTCNFKVTACYKSHLRRSLGMPRFYYHEFYAILSEKCKIQTNIEHEGEHSPSLKTAGTAFDSTSRQFSVRGITNLAPECRPRSLQASPTPPRFSTDAHRTQSSRQASFRRPLRLPRLADATSGRQRIP